MKFIPNTEKMDIINPNDFSDKKQNSILSIFFLISFVVGLSFTVFNTFIPSVFNLEFGSNANSIVSAIMLTGFLGQILSGYLGDKFDRIKLLSNPNELFTFDSVFGPLSTQQQVFTNVALPLIDDILLGYNGTIFAYGQTSSGKTHTMLGKDGANSSNTNLNGIIPQLSIDIFNRIKDQENDSRIVFQQQNMTGFQWFCFFFYLSH